MTNPMLFDAVASDCATLATRGTRAELHTWLRAEGYTPAPLMNGHTWTHPDRKDVTVVGSRAYHRVGCRLSPLAPKTTETLNQYARCTCQDHAFAITED